MENNYPALGAATQIVCFTGILGNLITLLIITKRKIFASEQNAHIFLGNLALVDLIACLLSIPMGISHFDSKTERTEFYCGSKILKNTIIRPLALLSLILLTINRYYVLTKRNAWKVFNKKRSWWYVIGIWCLAISFMVFMVSLFAVLSKSNITGACSLWDTCLQKGNKIGMIMVILSMGTIAYCNVRIWIHVRNHNKRISNQRVISKDVLRARNIKLAKIICAIFLSYIIVFIIPMIIITLTATKESAYVLCQIGLILFTATYANNFFIFVVADKRFRLEIKKTFVNCFGGKEPMVVTRFDPNVARTTCFRSTGTYTLKTVI